MPIIYPRHRLFWLVLEIPFLDNEIVSNDGLLSGQTRSWLPYSGGWSALFFYGERQRMMAKPVLCDTCQGLRCRCCGVLQDWSDSWSPSKKRTNQTAGSGDGETYTSSRAGLVWYF
jgi:hypothetical protein